MYNKNMENNKNELTLENIAKLIEASSTKTREDLTELISGTREDLTKLIEASSAKTREDLTELISGTREDLTELISGTREDLTKLVVESRVVLEEKIDETEERIVTMTQKQFLENQAHMDEKFTQVENKFENFDAELNKKVDNFTHKDVEPVRNLTAYHV